MFQDSGNVAGVVYRVGQRGNAGIVAVTDYQGEFMIRCLFCGVVGSLFRRSVIRCWGIWSLLGEDENRQDNRK